MSNSQKHGVVINGHEANETKCEFTASSYSHSLYEERLPRDTGHGKAFHRNHKEKRRFAKFFDSRLVLACWKVYMQLNRAS